MSDRLEVALVQAGYDEPEIGAPVRQLAAALSGAGHRPTVLAAHRAPASMSVEDGYPVYRSRRWSEAPLRARGFTGPLTHLPATTVRLLAGGHGLAHAFTPPDALAALWWRRLTGGPVVFTWTRPVTRERLSNRRLRLALVRRAIEEVDAVVAPSDEIQAGLERWFAIEAPVLDAGDVAAYERLYRHVACTRLGALELSPPQGGPRRGDASGGSPEI